jgi:hypothetical protein
LKKLLAKAFPFLYRTAWVIKPQHEVQLAFVHDGVEYFRFVNEQNIPSERAFAAIDIYEELNQRVTREYLEALFDSITAALNKGDLSKSAILVHFAKQRLNHITNVEILYKLASVLYFDKNENCYAYDREYNEKKINKWKKSADISGFFLRTPIGDYLPSFDGSQMNIQIYTVAQNKEMLHNMQSLLSLLSESESNREMSTKLRSQAESLRKWTDSLV